jgi:hypothetical protein
MMVMMFSGAILDYLSGWATPGDLPPPLFYTDIYSNSSVLKPNLPLRAQSIAACEFPSAAKVLSAWAGIAREKAKSPQATDSEKEQFKSCEWISNTIAKRLSDVENENAIYACKDSERNIQGAMVLDKKQPYLYIELLTTNPTNIRSAVNKDEPKKVRGAGTCLLHKAEEVAAGKGKTKIKLIPESSAQEFYSKNGFSRANLLWEKTL